LIQSGLDPADAKIVSSGLAGGMKTLTSDYKTLARKAPTVTEVYQIPRDD